MNIETMKEIKELIRVTIKDSLIQRMDIKEMKERIRKVIKDSRELIDQPCTYAEDYVGAYQDLISEIEEIIGDR